MLVMARYILPASYGQLSLFTTMVSLLTIFICLNTNGFISISFFGSPRIRIQRLLNVVLLTTLLMYLFLLTSLFCFNSFFTKVVGLNVTFQFFAISICTIQVLSTSLLDVWRLEEKVWQYGTFSLLNAICNLLFTFCFVGIFSLDWLGRVYVQLVVCIVFSLLSIYILINKKYLRRVLPTKSDFKESYTFGIPLIPHSTSFWLRQGLDRYIINYYISQSMVGLYSFATNISNVIQIIGYAFNTSNSVSIYKILSGNENNKLAKLQHECYFLVILYFILTILCFLGAVLFIPFIFPEYIDCIQYLFPLCISAMFQCFYLVYVNIIFFYKQTLKLMFLTVLVSLLHVSFSFVFTRYGVIYTAYISLVSNMLICIGVYWYSQKLLDQFIHLSLKDI